VLTGAPPDCAGADAGACRLPELPELFEELELLDECESSDEPELLDEGCELPDD
jgi:hypothetical protein